VLTRHCPGERGLTSILDMPLRGSKSREKMSADAKGHSAQPQGLDRRKGVECSAQPARGTELGKKVQKNLDGTLIHPSCWRRRGGVGRSCARTPVLSRVSSRQILPKPAGQKPTVPDLGPPRASARCALSSSRGAGTTKDTEGPSDAPSNRRPSLEVGS